MALLHAAVSPPAERVPVRGRTADLDPEHHLWPSRLPAPVPNRGPTPGARPNGIVLMSPEVLSARILAGVRSLSESVNEECREAPSTTRVA